MSQDFSEESIRKNCPHCDPNSHAFEFSLEETIGFRIVCDAHSLTEGHILIIPKGHFSCIAEYPTEVLAEYKELDKKVSDFIMENFGSVSSFEHGKFGQTVFHSHVHYIPFDGKPTDIVPEGEDKIYRIDSVDELKKYFQKDGGYLYFTIGNMKWVVDASLAVPRFFRDRFAKALGRPERGNWKKMHVNTDLMEVAREDNYKTQKFWARK